MDNTIKLIHIAKTKLGMDDDTYRAMLKTVAGVTSSKELDAQGREKVMAHLKKCGFKVTSRPKVAVDKQALVSKIRAQLISLGNLDDNYAHGIAKQMFKIERFDWCDASQLRAIIAALAKKQQKDGADTQ